ncbi:hypothetical protein A6J53_13510 [Neisseria meningitidis]|nr:hypothetical protein A6J53_13510 [Neisseria meningitidis]RFN61089.1 hypothetical protein CH607_04915 [Haemophilus influenzae]RFO30863.1 hypothetical protein CH610_04420 [Haemophilus influenzae]RFO35393.1 hypothetical protein CH609_06255 [Haemophilus influenzae]
MVQIFSIYFLFIKSKRLLFAILSSQFENVYNCPRYSQNFWKNDRTLPLANANLSSNCSNL